ncbi:MAG: hypothetical protein ACOC2J_05170 [bacterium]
MDKIIKYLRNFLYIILNFFKKTWNKLKSEFEFKKVKNQVSKNKEKDNTRDEDFSDHNIKLTWGKVKEIDEYDPEEFLENDNIIENGLFQEQLSSWIKQEKNQGKVIIETTDKNKNYIKLFIPENSKNSLAGIKHNIKLKPDTNYCLFTKVKTTSLDVAPLLFLCINNSQYRLRCKKEYTCYQLCFKSNSDIQTISLNTGIKWSKYSSTFYIDNIFLKEIKREK